MHRPTRLDAALAQSPGDARDESVELAVRPRRDVAAGVFEDEEGRVATRRDGVAPAPGERRAIDTRSPSHPFVGSVASATGQLEAHDVARVQLDALLRANGLVVDDERAGRTGRPAE